ncbi:hypothetical protein IWZ00DRAFT_530655 [Phyllosticta capitalensis]|uniref:uncharacterized protein n=1 Tax=Phyllosticta capitalensis TaxID=121624 RepID=UPI003131E1AE
MRSRHIIPCPEKESSLKMSTSSSFPTARDTNESRCFEDQYNEDGKRAFELLNGWAVSEMNKFAGSHTHVYPEPMSWEESYSYHYFDSLTMFKESAASGFESASAERKDQTPFHSESTDVDGCEERSASTSAFIAGQGLSMERGKGTTKLSG